MASLNRLFLTIVVLALFSRVSYGQNDFCAVSSTSSTVTIADNNQ